MSETLNQPMNRQQRRRMERAFQKQASQLRASRAAENAATKREQSQLQAYPGSRFLDQREVDYGISVIEQFDGMAGLRNGLRKIAVAKREWAGIPMLLQGERLIIEPTYPRAKELSDYGKKDDAEDGIEGAVVRNTFWSHRRRQWITIWNEGDKIEWGVTGLHNHVGEMLSTLGVSDAWGIEQEKNAVDTLGTLLRHRQFKQYLLTGMFMEKSERSGLHYVFRRLRPTLAISTAKADSAGESRVIAALCLHPIAYYAGSWGGAMCPTDNVVAHLALMRGDEHMFWKRANQHPAWVPQAGIG